MVNIFCVHFIVAVAVFMLVILLITLLFFYSYKIDEALSKRIIEIEKACGCLFNTVEHTSLEKRVEFLEKHSQAFLTREKNIMKFFEESRSQKKDGGES